LPVSNIPARLRVSALILRAVFIAALVVVTVHVSMPQNETIWTAYDTPDDLIRMALGLAVCVGLVIQLFRRPRDASGYRTWIYLGLAAIPFAVICLVYTW
jgi:archaellum biogenesis protein FlaJ (TadC family)